VDLTTAVTLAELLGDFFLFPVAGGVEYEQENTENK